MKINPSKCKAVHFTRAQVKDSLNYTLWDQLIPEVKKAWKALHFIMRILKKGNSSTKSLAYTTLILPILEYGAVCWDPYMEGQIHALHRLKKKEAKFAYHTNEPNWETLSQCRKISRICALFKPYSGEWAWKAIGNRLQRPNYLSWVDHNRKSGIGGKG